MGSTDEKLQRIQQFVKEGLTTDSMTEVLRLIGFSCEKEEIESFRLWNDYLPRAEEYPYTQEQRYLHILWELIDRVPLGINCAFSIPFRRILAKKLFKKCGDGFIANEGTRFNFGNLIEVGDNVAWNHCCYIDAKGGVKFGDYSMMTEYAKIFTHGHSESDHMIRTYNGVEIGEYAKIYTASTVLAGVHIGKGAIVATGAVVTKDVDDFTVVAGIPAKPVRKRRTEEGETPEELNHYTLKDKWFQKGGAEFDGE